MLTVGSRLGFAMVREANHGSIHIPHVKDSAENKLISRN